MRQTLLRQLKLFLFILVGYLAHVSIMPYVNLGGMSPSLVVSCTAIVIVGYGMLQGLWAGMFYGIVLEIMLPTVPMLNLLFYPISALLCAVFFADRSAAQLQYQRSIGKRGRNTSPLFRTIMCTAVNMVIYEIVNLAYMYLSGATISMILIQRALTDALTTTLLTAIIMVPARKLLGFRKKEEARTPEMRFDHRPARD